MVSTFALVAMTSVLFAGCSVIPAGKSGSTELTPITPTRSPNSVATPAGPAGTSTSAPSKAGSISAPGAGESVESAISWVQAAPPADSADFRVALRAGNSTPLGEDTAFTTPSGISCMTDTKRDPGSLACLVDLVNPPPPPADVYGVWKGGWVDFDGSGVRVGSAHGDPGRFTLGSGSPLPQENSLAFGNFRCRADVTTLVCVNYARKTAVRYSDDGITAYGCTRQDPPAAGVGQQYACG